jgi:DNA-directed RNA polymerase, subunit F (EC 2.7.7.6)
VPYAYVKERLKALIESGKSSQTIQRAFDYLNSLSKCSSEDANNVMEELKDVVENEDVRVVLSSVCPTTADEVRTILTMDTGKTYSPEDVDKIVQIISKYIKT